MIPKQQVKGYRVDLFQVQNEIITLVDTPHRHIVGVARVLEDRQFYYIVQEYLKHGSLQDLIIQRRRAF